jgi:acyl-CoA thioesterase
VNDAPQYTLDAFRAVEEIPPGDILADITPTPVEGIPGRYVGHIPEAWRVIYAFGGTTMAATIRAAVVELAREDLVPVGAESTFCQAVPCGPIGLQVEVLRQGRNGAQALVRLWALDPADPDPRGLLGNDVVTAVVLGRRKESSLEIVADPAPDVPDPGDCRSREDDEASPFRLIPYHRQTDFRMIGRRTFAGPTPPGEPVTDSWFRFEVSPCREDGNWEPAALAVPGDILGAAVHAGLGTESGYFFVVSLQIGLKFVADLSSEWVLQHTRAHSASAGYASGISEIYDLDRNLVAIATQTALLRPFSTDPGATDA